MLRRKNTDRVQVVLVLPGFLMVLYNLYHHIAQSSTGWIQLNGLAITMVVTGLFLCLIDRIDRKINPGYLDEDF